MNPILSDRDSHLDRQEAKRRLVRDSVLFRDTPLVSPTVTRWGNVPGHVLLRTDQKRIPSPKAFAEVVWAGVPQNMPEMPPPVPVECSGNDEPSLADQFAWWDTVRSWRAECDPPLIGKSWLLSGTPGTGKTRASVARAQVWSLATGVEAMPLSSLDYFRANETTRIAFVRGVDFTAAAVAEARGDESNIKGVSDLGSLGHVPFLILDDVDAGNWTPSAISAFYKLMDDRLNGERPTILSFNGTAQDWFNRVTSRYPDEGIMVQKILRRIGDICTHVVFAQK